MKQIVLVTTSFPDAAFQPGQEAAGAFVADFAEELAQHLHVTVIAPSGRNDREQLGNLIIHRFAVPSLPLSLLKPTNPTQWPNIIRTLRAGEVALKTAVMTTKVDHIFALWALPSGYWARNMWNAHGIPYSIWALGSDIWSLGKIPVVKSALYRVLRDSQVRFADGFLLKDDVEKIARLGCEFLPSTRKLSVKAGKELAQRPPYRLVFIGRWHPHKGVDLLLDSLGLLSDEDWNQIEAVQICGGGPLEDMVRSRCAALKAAGRPVAVRGYLDEAEVVELLAWADYLLLPSRIESIPVIFSDAMQANCPIVSTPVGDLPRLLTNNSVGILARSVTPQAFAQATQQALSTSPSQCGADLQTVQQQFSVQQSVRSFLNVLSRDK